MPAVPSIEVHFIQYVVRGRKVFWKESLSEDEAHTLANCLELQGYSPEIISCDLLACDLAALVQGPRNDDRRLLPSLSHS